MGTYLVLEGAKILEAQGFGGGNLPTGLHTIKFEDEGVFAVYGRGLFGGLKKIYWSSFGKLEFYVGTVGVQSGGGWVGGGIGIGGALKGAATASVLNALTTRNREYAVLTVIDHDLTTGAQKIFSMGFQNMDEAALRRQLAEVIPDWTEPVAKQMEALFEQCDSVDEALEGVAMLEGLLERGIFSEEQGERLLAVLRAKAPAAFPEPTAPPAPVSSMTRVEQLKTLSELRASGALSEEEFQREKQLVLQGSSA